MKAIELTEEHKSKLLEMCTALFPKQVDSITYNNLISLNGAGEYIHWFEFCMTHLQVNLQIRLKNWIDKWNQDLAGVNYAYFNSKKRTHIVDYLYTEFKKIKTT